MKSYNIDKELRILRPMRYKKYSNLRRILINLFFNMSMYFGKPRKGIVMKKHTIVGYKNQKIKIYVLKHKIINPNQKGLLYLHGGGFQIEGTPVHIRMTSNMIYDSGHTAVYVKYRLAPKHPFPIGLEDCYHAYLWMLENHKKLNIDMTKISVAGDSAGGNLAVGVALLARDRQKQIFDKMLLFYPVIDHRQITPSMKAYDDTPMWNSILNKSMWELYLKNGDFGMLNYTSLLLGDLSGLPKTYIETAEYDCLRGEGIWFAEKLKSLGVELVERHTKKTVHGYDAVFFSDFIKERVKDRSDFLRGEDDVNKNKYRYLE
jgi:acetyl esterase